MREVDTEAPVVWPAWCYSANTQESAIDVISKKGDPASDLLSATSPTSYVQPSPNTILSAYSGGLKSRSRRKNTYTNSLASASSSSLSVTSVPSTSPASADQSINNEKIQQHLQLSSFLINKKMLSERILMGFSGSSLESPSSNNSPSDNLNSNNSSSSNINNNNNNNTSSANSRKNCDISVYDKIKNEPHIMDSSPSNLKNGDLITTNNNAATVNLVTAKIKNERLSPSLNGDVQSSMSRSRSATPTSFPDMSPQSSDLTMTPSILNSSRTNEFQARHYSDFMRSLAAKYNNSNPNDTAAARNLFSSPSKKPPNKESPSPPEVKRTSVPTPPHLPFVPPLFPGLPFSSAVFPPLIDMSSTQALVTLARAAKEVELQKILNQNQKRPGVATSQSLSPALRTVIATTEQQLAQFNNQSLLLPAQFPQHSPSQRSPQNVQSPKQYRGEPSSSSVTATTSTSLLKRLSSPPLDLSATQHTKRVKRESVTSSPATSPSACSILGTTTSSNNANTSQAKTKPESPAVGTTISTSAVEFPRHCRSQSDEISSWTIDDVCNFVNNIDICGEYVQKFRDQCIDGSGLPLLTEDHLTNSLGMKLGPALKLRSVLAKMLGGPCPCVSCTTLFQQQQQHIVQHQTSASASHLTPPQVASSSSTISSSSSTLQLAAGSATSSSASSANLSTNNANNSKNPTSNTASNNVPATSSAGGSANTPVRPASADSGS